MGQLLLWNKTNYANALAGIFGNENIITDDGLLKRVLKRWEDYDSVIILCELNWSSGGEVVNPQTVYGLELAKELRLENRINLPILFVSFLSLAEIFNAEREIITAIGHSFQRLPVSPDDFKSFIEKEFNTATGLKKLSEMELTDIQSFYCSKEGILAHELHYLNSYLNYKITADNHDAVYLEFENSIRKIYNLFLADALNSLLAFQVAFPVLTKENINEAVDKVKHIGENLSKIYGEKESGASSDNSIEFHPWKVLLLDDQIDERHELVLQMKANNIRVICAGNADEASAILKANWETENNIMVIIADYRLYEVIDGIRHHQKVQGYQFLKSIASTDHLVRLVALSGLQRKFLFNSFSNYNIRTEVKSKTDYLASSQTMQLFCEEIILLAEENRAAIEAMPSKCAGFEKYLLGAYKSFRLHPSYRKWEDNISLTAKEYVQELQTQLKEGSELRIGAIDNIKSPLAKTQKDPEAYFNRFQNYMVARRIALWLYAVNKRGLGIGVDSRRIAEILTDQKYPTDAYRQVLSTNLGLSLDDFPKNITIEERRWLQYDMQLNIFRDIAVIDTSFQKISNYYGETIRSEPNLMNLIIENAYTMSIKYKNTLYNIDFEPSFNPVLKTATDIRVMYLMIENYTAK